MSRYRVVNTKQNQADYKTGQLLDRDTGSSEYVLPTATQSIKGGVRVGNNLYMTGETLNATDQRYDDTEVFERLDNLDEDITMIEEDITSLTLEKQDELVSGTTIKTINGESLLGSGDVQATGAKGDQGKDGFTPYIGLNGNWWINNQDTGIKAQGPAGNDGTTPHIGDNGNWFLGLLDTGVKAQGQTGVTGNQGVQGIPGQTGPAGNDGITPHIGDNGNWFLGLLDTGIQAQGQTGATGNQGVHGIPGQTGPAGNDGITPHIGDNGNWFLGLLDTGIQAQGQTGATGNQGVQGIPGQTGPAGSDGITPHIGDNGNWFLGLLDTGVQAQGQTGVTGSPGITPHIGENGNWYVGTTDTGVHAQGPTGSSEDIVILTDTFRITGAYGSCHPGFNVRADGFYISTDSSSKSITCELYNSNRHHLYWDVNISQNVKITDSSTIELSTNSEMIGFASYTNMKLLTADQVKLLSFTGTSGYIEDVTTGTILAYLTRSVVTSYNQCIGSVDFTNKTTSTVYINVPSVKYNLTAAKLPTGTTVDLVQNNKLRWHIFGY